MCLWYQNRRLRRAEDAEAKLLRLELKLDEIKLLKIGFTELGPEMKNAAAQEQQRQKQNSIDNCSISREDINVLPQTLVSCSNISYQWTIILILQPKFRYIHMKHFTRIHAGKLVSLYTLPCVIGCTQHSIG